MKKILLLFIVGFLLVASMACSGEASEPVVEEEQTAIIETVTEDTEIVAETQTPLDEFFEIVYYYCPAWEGKFTCEEVSKGYRYTYYLGGGIDKTKIIVECDEYENTYYMEAYHWVYYGDTMRFSDASDIKKTTKLCYHEIGDTGDVNGDMFVQVVSLYLDMLYYSIVGNSAGDAKYEFLASEDGSTWEVNEWIFTINKETNAITIIAKYVG